MSQGASADSDNDGVLDAFEDADGDGPDDGVAAVPTDAEDIDRDGRPNHLALDTDGDGRTDREEAAVIERTGHADDDGDGDGVPDVADVNAIGGGDAEGEGIDDATDVDVVGGSDTDGDGIADVDDATFGAQASTSTTDAAAPVDPGAAPSPGTVRTGLNGGGCSIGGASRTAPDPLFALLVLGAGLLGLSGRRAARGRIAAGRTVESG